MIIVRISELAQASLVLSALEAYAIEHLRNKKEEKNKLETHGTLFGYETYSYSKEIVYQIELVSTDTSTRQWQNKVRWSRSARDLKQDFITSFYPNFDYLGTFHTHPYDHYKSVPRGDHGSYFSKGDLRSFHKNKEYHERVGSRVFILVTVAGMQKAGTLPNQHITNNIIQVTFGNLRLWISAYCVLNRSDSDPPDLVVSPPINDYVFLECPNLNSLIEYTDFGRFKDGKYFASWELNKDLEGYFVYPSTDACIDEDDFNARDSIDSYNEKAMDDYADVDEFD